MFQSEKKVAETFKIQGRNLEKSSAKKHEWLPFLPVRMHLGDLKSGATFHAKDSKK